MLSQINKLAAGLVSLGLEVGAKIGILSPNLYEWVVTQFAASRAGLVLVSLANLEFVLPLKHAYSDISKS